MRLDLEPHETPVDVRNGIIKSEQWCRYYCGAERCVAKEGGSLSPESVCINWILFFKVWLICLGLLSSGDHFVGCQPQIPAQEWLRSLAWLIKGFWHQSLTLPCQCHYAIIDNSVSRSWSTAWRSSAQRTFLLHSLKWGCSGSIWPWS